MRRGQAGAVGTRENLVRADHSLKHSPTLRSLTHALIACATVACGAQSEEPVRPAVLLISIDTLRPDHLGLHGYARDTSPFLDRWAENALVFERAFTPFSWTLTAHMTMLTGLHPTQHGVVVGNRALAPSLPTLAERLRAAGYGTVGLYHPGWIDERHGFARGFEVFRAHENVAAAKEHLFEELARLDRTRPWFVFLHLFDVHNGRLAGEPPGIYTSPPPFHEHFLPGASRRLAGLDREDCVDGEVELTPEQIEALIALYDDGIRHVDHELGETFARLEREGWLENTLVVVTSDHGEALGPTWERPSAGGARLSVAGHGGIWQEGLRVPLLVKPPGFAGPGRRSNAPVQLADIAPTILATAGLEAPGLGGHSLLAELPPGRTIGGGGPNVEWVLDWPRKLVLAPRGRCYGVDLERDPDELAIRNVSREEFDAVRAGLPFGTEALAPWVVLPRLGEESRARLEELGYGGELEDD